MSRTSARFTTATTATGTTATDNSNKKDSGGDNSNNNDITGTDGNGIVSYLEQHNEITELYCGDGILTQSNLQDIDKSLRNYHSAIHLIKLELPNNKLGPNCGPLLASILESQRETLLELNLSYNPLSSVGIDYLIEPLSDPPVGVSSIMPSCVLQTLDLTNTQLGTKGATSISRLIKNNRTLKTLLLGGNDLKQRGISKIAPELANNHSLQTISLQNNKLGVRGASIFAKALYTNTTATIQDQDLDQQQEQQQWTIKSLDLAGNDIRKAGIDGAFHDLLVLDRNIQILQLGYNNLGSEGGALLGLVLRHNYTLKELCIQGNSIGDVGVLCIADELRTNNNTLEKLQLDWNNITSRGAIGLANALKQNSTLDNISLADNDIDSEGVATIADSITYNMALKKLNLNKNRIDDDGIFALTMALGRPSCSDLSVLIDDNLDVTDVGITSFQRIPTLKRNLSSWFGDLLKAISNGTVSSIDLSSNHINAIIGEEEIFMLTATLADYYSSHQNQQTHSSSITTTHHQSYNELNKKRKTIQSLWLGGRGGSRSKGNRNSSNSTLSSRCIIQLAHLALSGLTNPVVRVYIHSIYIGDDGAEAFGHAIQDNPTMTVLVLNDCGITSDGCQALANGLSRNINGSSALRRLNLDRNSIGDEGMSYIVSAIPHHAKTAGSSSSSSSSSLTSLSVAYNGLTDTVLSHPELAMLEELNLNGNNDITDRGALQLCPHLMDDGCRLQRLSLYKTQVTSRGRDTLQNFLPNKNAVVDYG